MKRPIFVSWWSSGDEATLLQGREALVYPWGSHCGRVGCESLDLDGPWILVVPIPKDWAEIQNPGTQASGLLTKVIRTLCELERHQTGNVGGWG